MTTIQNKNGLRATERIYIKQVLNGTFKLGAVMLLTAALLISGI